MCSGVLSAAMTVSRVSRCMSACGFAFLFLASKIKAIDSHIGLGDSCAADSSDALCAGGWQAGAATSGDHSLLQLAPARSWDEGRRDRGQVTSNRTCSSCLCVFDIDRTLTGKQGDVGQCPRNRVLEMWDAGYGGGKATLSALSSEGIATTFCNQCYLGITSAGHGSGEWSEWNAYVLDNIMRGEHHDHFITAHPEYKRWSFGMNVRSPYVLGQGNRIKQRAVERIRSWYGEPGRNVCIPPGSVYFFGDRTENIEPFAELGLNSREISCSSRDPYLYGGSGMVGYCGATPEEVLTESGSILCN